MPESSGVLWLSMIDRKDGGTVYCIDTELTSPFTSRIRRLPRRWIDGPFVEGVQTMTALRWSPPARILYGEVRLRLQESADSSPV